MDKATPVAAAPRVRQTPDTNPLFQPYRLGPFRLPHRMVMAPLTRSRARQPGNVPSSLAARYYAQRASAALIVSEATQLSMQGQGYAWTPGIHSREQVEAWRQVTRAVHQADGLIFNQLWHAVRISHRALQPDNMLPVYRRPSDLLKLAAPSSSARCSSTDISGSKIRSTPSRPTTLGSDRVTRNLSL